MDYTKIFFNWFFWLLLSGSVIGFFASCGRETISDKKTYFSYLLNPENGLVREKSIAGVKYRVRYLPADYFRYNVLKNMSFGEKNRDSIASGFDSSLTFLFTIGPGEAETFDITRVGVKDYAEFADRIEEFAFWMQEKIFLDTGDSLVSPAISRMENLNAQSKSRDFIVVFDSKVMSKLTSDRSLSFVYRDDVFGTGINKFVFLGEDIENVPHLKF